MKKKIFFAGILAFSLTISCACFNVGDKDSSATDSVSSSSPNHNISSSAESSMEEFSSEEFSANEDVSSSEDSIVEESSDNNGNVSEEDTESSESTESASDSSDEAYCTVQFDSDEGTEVPAVTLLKGEKLTPPATPQKTSKNCEYTFLGWYYNGELWDFESNVVTEDITLIAHWEEGDKFSDPFLPKD